MRDTAVEPGTKEARTSWLTCLIFHWRFRTWGDGTRYSVQFRPWCKLCVCYR